MNIFGLFYIFEYRIYRHRYILKTDAIEYIRQVAWCNKHLDYRFSSESKWDIKYKYPKSCIYFKRKEDYAWFKIGAC
jgi:hypothetical protein